MTGEPVANLADVTPALPRRSVRALTLVVAAALMFPFPGHAATLKPETLRAWEEYLQVVRIQARDRSKPQNTFLWIDEMPSRAAKVRRGDIVVFAAEANNSVEIPSGLIHHWIGAVFIANAKLNQIITVLREYGRYKDFFRPAVIDSKPVFLSDAEDRFSMILANKTLFHKSALDSDYTSWPFRVDDRRQYTIAQTTRVQEIAEYGAAGQHTLAEDEGTGFLWRLLAVTRFEERDGGVCVEVEALALSRDIPASLRWIVEPIARRVAKSSLITSLEQTREAVRSNASLRVTAAQ